MQLKPIPVAVLVSGGGTNLQAILDACREGSLPSVQIALAVSDRGQVKALDRAKASAIKTLAFNRKEKGWPETETEILDALIQEGIEVVVLAGFLSILSAKFIGTFPNRILNVHPSLIPAFCGKNFYGLSVHEAALQRGVKITGATVHLVNEEPDGGPILAQKAVPVLPEDTPQILQQRVMEQAEWVLLPQTLENFCQQLIKKGNPT